MLRANRLLERRVFVKLESIRLRQQSQKKRRNARTKMNATTARESGTTRLAGAGRSATPLRLRRPAPGNRDPIWTDYLAFFVGLPVGIGILFSLVGTRLTMNMPYLPALLYLILHMFIAWWAVSVGCALIKFCFRSWKPPTFAVVIIGYMIATIPAAFLFQAFGDFYAEIYPVFAENRADENLPSWNLDYLLHFIRYSIPALPLFWVAVSGYWYITGVNWFGYPTDSTADDSEVEEQDESGVTRATAALIEGSKLADDAELLAIKAEQHYIHIWSDQGTDLVRYRFKDIPETLQSCNGAQVHRSWWVNLDKVRSFEQKGRKLELNLGDKLTVPVSLSYKNAVINRLGMSRVTTA
jgi:hypothetical protein